MVVRKVRYPTGPEEVLLISFSVTPLHFAFALLSEDPAAYDSIEDFWPAEKSLLWLAIERSRADPYNFLIELKKRIQAEVSQPIPWNSSRLVSASKALEEIVAGARALKQDMVRDSYIAPEHLALALLKDRGIAGFFAHYQVETVLLSRVVSHMKRGPIKSRKAGQKHDWLNRFGVDLTAKAEAGELDPVIGRDSEIRRVIRVLCRRTRNSPVLVGEPGVGKTAVAEALAQRIVEKDVPASLSGKIYALDMGSLIAGTTSRGDYEETRRDAANLFKPALACGKLRCIGATTLAEYREHIEKDGALERRFAMIMLNEPSVEDTISILRGIQANYERHHGVIIRQGALVTAAQLAQRYMTQRRLPDSAVDLIDEACAAAKVARETDALDEDGDNSSQAQQKLLAARNALNEIQMRIASLPEISRKHRERKKRMVELRKSILSRKIEERMVGSQGDIAKASSLAVLISQEEDELQRLETAGIMTPVITAEDVAAVVERSTKIPITRLLATDKEELLHLEEILMEKIGSPPGYVGFEQGGQLTEYIRRNPYSIILIGDIEKACSEFESLLLQVLEDGRLADGQGRVADFRNTIIIMTSNLGSDVLAQDSDEESDRKIERNAEILDAIDRHFSPELLNRIDDIVVFGKFASEDAERIVNLRIQETTELLAKRKLQLDLDGAARQSLADVILKSERGARPLNREIQNRIINQISTYLLQDRIREGDVVKVKANGGVVYVEPNDQSKRAAEKRPQKDEESPYSASTSSSQPKSQKGDRFLAPFGGARFREATELVIDTAPGPSTRIARP
ncbi:hypothetical protein FRC00_006326 [Tulasnella sp. 408]|nr:hypothetical protein FRC00_006326 [Tulasnella sp. 408]